MSASTPPSSAPPASRWAGVLSWFAVITCAAALGYTFWFSTFRTLSDDALRWTRFLGRFHPVVLHLPIGLFAGLFAIEGIGYLKPDPGFRRAAHLLLLLAVLGATAAACLGLLLFADGDYTGANASWHKWLGLAFAVGALVALALKARSARRGVVRAERGYLASLFVLAGVLPAAGHFGGNLTHGSTYLTEHAPPALRDLFITADPAALGAADTTPDVYRDTVQPILKQYCFGCHGPEKQKSGYRLDTFEHLMAGGKLGETPVVPFEPGESFLINALWRPESHELAMPPEGKPRPSADEILTLTHWVARGAQGPALNAAAQQALREALAERDAAVGTLEENGVVVLPLGRDDPRLYVDFVNTRGPLDDAGWAALASLKKQIAELRITRHPPGWEAFDRLRDAPQLTRLTVGGMAEVAPMVATLNSLAALEHLNLHGSGLSDEGLARLAPPALRELYLGATETSTAARDAFGAAHPAVRVVGDADLAEVDAIREAAKDNSTRFDPEAEADADEEPTP